MTTEQVNIDRMNGADATQYCLDRIDATVIVEGETPAELQRRILDRVKDMLKPTWFAVPMTVNGEKIAPVQGWPQGIPWSLHMEAYAVYSKKWSPQPALIQGWCRGGFSTGELDEFIPGWRERVSEITALRAENASLRRMVHTLQNL